VRGEETPFEIYDPSEERIEVNPGNVVTKVLFVSNRSSSEAEVHTVVSLPEGWILLSGKQKLSLEVKQGDMVLVSFFIPEEIPAGSYSVTYSADADSTYTFPVTVLPLRKISLEVLKTPDFAIAGETFQLVFQVQNMGNIPLSLFLSAKTEEGFYADIDTPQFPLNSGALRIVKVYVDTDSNLRKSIRALTRLTAKIGDDSNIRAEGSAVVEVLPRITGEEKKYYTLPSEITLKQTLDHSAEDTYALQAVITGEGPLDEEESRFLKYRFQRSFPDETNLVSERDVFHLDVTGELWNMYLGDRFFTLSELTENSKYGKGAEANYSPGDRFTFGGFTMLSSRVSPIAQESAAYVRFSPENRQKYTLNYLHKDYLEDDDIISFNGQIYLHEQDLLGFEAAGSSGRNSSEAAVVTLSGSREWMNYRFRGLHAGPDFPGTWKDVNLFTSNFSFPLKDSVSLSALCGASAYNLKNEMPSFREFYQSGFHWRMNRTSRFFITWQHIIHEDRLPEPENWYEENRIRMNLLKDMNKVSLFSSIEFGAREDFTASQRLALEGFRAGLAYNPNENHSLRAESAYGFTELHLEPKESLALTGTWLYKINQRTSLSLAVKTTNFTESYYTGNDSLSLTFNHEFLNGHKITASGMYTPQRLSEKKTDFRVSLSYSTPFGIPVKRLKNSGKVYGYVFIKETGEPLQDVILRMDSSIAVTDIYGRFVFHSLAPGTYPLYLDISGEPGPLVAEPSLPLTLEVKNDEITNIEIPFTLSSSLTGNVFIYSRERTYTAKSEEEIDAYSNPEGLKDLLITIKRGDEVERAVTDNEGAFAFPRLRPGAWTVSINENQVPPGYFLYNNEFTLQLESGDAGEIVFKVLPERREIQFIDEDIIRE